MIKAKSISLKDASSFGISIIEGKTKGEHSLFELIIAQRANRRSGTASTKTRAEVRGSGRKIYRQKGTGNARHGDRRAPIFVGGGVAFGPKPRSYEKKMPKKMKKLAFSRALTQVISEEKVYSLPDFVVQDGKTKTFVSQVKEITDAKKVLIIGVSFASQTYLAARNVPHKMLSLSSEVDVESLLLADCIIFTDDALTEISSRTRS